MALPVTEVWVQVFAPHDPPGQASEYQMLEKVLMMMQTSKKNLYILTTRTLKIRRVKDCCHMNVSVEHVQLTLYECLFPTF